MRDLLKRYAKLALGQPFTPGLLNILVTSVCDMRCTHCFFTEELDNGPRKKFQMKTEEIERISETLGGNLGVLILAGGEPFTRKDLPEIVRAFYTNNRLESVYITSNGQIQKRIFPDVYRMLQECPKLNVTVALGIDGLKEQHDKIRRKPGSWEIVIDTARQLQAMKKEYQQLDVQTCTCLMNSNQDTIFEWYDFLKYELKPDKFYKGESQEKQFCHSWKFSDFPARVNEQGWFCLSAPWARFAAQPGAAVWVFTPDGVHRVVATKPVRSETDKQQGCQVPTMVLSEARGL